MNVSGRSSVGSAAVAICNHVRDLFLGSNGRVVSMGVYSHGGDKYYGIKEGLIFSVPCICEGKGVYKVVEGWKLNDKTKEWIQKNEKELEDEFS